LEKSNENEKGIVYLKDNDNLEVCLVSTIEEHDKMLGEIAFSNKDTTHSFLLLGVTEQRLRKRMSELELPKESLKKIQCWESGLGCIWADEFLSIIKEYIQTWKKYSKQNHLHIIIDDFANLGFFPLMEKEKSLIPAIINICRTETMYRGYDVEDKNDDSDNKKTDIKLTFVCTDPEKEVYKHINKLITNYKNN